MEKNNHKSAWQDFYLSLYRLGLRNQIYAFLDNLNSLLSAGLNISESMGSILEEMRSKRMRRIISDLKTEIDQGVSLSAAVLQWNFLPERTVSLIRLGELSGKLVDNLGVIVVQNEKDELFRSKVRSSLLYAVIIFTMAIIVGTFTSWFVLPKLADVFISMGVELPFVTKVLVESGILLAKYGYIVVPFFLSFLLCIFYFIFSFPKTKFIGHTILFRTPFIKKIILHTEVARFGFLLGTMLQAGLPIVQALTAMPGTTTFKNYRLFYEYLIKEIAEGNSFKKSFTSYPSNKKLFPVTVRQMIIAGEKSGQLDKSLLHIGHIYEAKVEETAKNLPVILEPILLLIIGLGVAILAVGIIMPIYRLTEII